MRSRQPKRLILAFFGEYVFEQNVEPVRASVLIDVLDGAGIAASATRATLVRLVAHGILARERKGREIMFSLTDAGSAVLREAGDRVRGQHSFTPQGDGWTMVTFTIPEDQRTLRHRLRSTLTWERFAPLRDGLWLAPGDVDLDAVLEPLRADLPTGALTAFRARELPGYSMDASVAAAWDLDRIRGEHEAFIEAWSDLSTMEAAGSALSARTMLVADWLGLLRVDPRLPPEFLGADWPSPLSAELYWSWRAQLADDALAEFARRVPAAPAPVPPAAYKRPRVISTPGSSRALG
ncbi:PaaX family transcriptional regulator [Salinibacterium hongtaonis]|uniref:PadR family transcriptional regulator n=1 Tax=Homoserinimonas hongtaonis TaxID=2079791 RepID=A0A2U1T260_9MICO|nr:PaaX family transcriptional regulator C-terminal domain-containing protein [Salinibacterium hongtaonis]PWB97964.1 PadR family transcriptional regulator [Salinibacterium hongtaonis]